jgi:glutathione S-transferase
MSLKLYFAPGACSFVPHTLLEAAGVPFEPVMVKLHKGENQQPAYLAINPRGQVPVLVHGDEVITQIVAICTYLDARFPEAGFLPAEPLARARVMETLAWMNNTVHTTFTHFFMPHKFATDEAVFPELRRHAAQLYRGMVGELEALAQSMAAQGRAFLGGDRLGPLDPYALTLLRWGTMTGIDPQAFPALWAHVQRVAQLPAVARAIERERLQLSLYKPA